MRRMTEIGFGRYRYRGVCLNSQDVQGVGDDGLFQRNPPSPVSLDERNLGGIGKGENVQAMKPRCVGEEAER